MLAYKCNTTQYVHRRFLDDYAAFRAQQSDFGGKSRTLDLHKVRLGISELLAKSTNHILKVRDCCQLLNMTTAQADKWTQRRFFFQVLILSEAGYIRRVRVPGKATGSLIMCVQLIKEYKETDDFMLRKDRQITAQGEAEDEGDADVEDEDAFQAKGDGEDLDVTRLNHDEQLVEPSGPTLSREVVLELQIQRKVAESGTTGTSGPQLRQQLLGNHWSRPFDEQMKRLAPNAVTATQPGNYASLALGPPCEEIAGKVRQYRYYTIHNVWCGLGEGAANISTISELDGKFPELEKEDISRETPVQYPAEFSRSKRITASGELLPSKKGRPRKDHSVESAIQTSGALNNGTDAGIADHDPDDQELVAFVNPRKRGRPRKEEKSRLEVQQSGAVGDSIDPGTAMRRLEGEAGKIEAPPRKRGRPRKVLGASQKGDVIPPADAIITQPDAAAAAAEEETEIPVVRKKSGRTQKGQYNESDAHKEGQSNVSAKPVIETHDPQLRVSSRLKGRSRNVRAGELSAKKPHEVIGQPVMPFDLVEAEQAREALHKDKMIRSVSTSTMSSSQITPEVRTIKKRKIQTITDLDSLARHSSPPISAIRESPQMFEEETSPAEADPNIGPLVTASECVPTVSPSASGTTIQTMPKIVPGRRADSLRKPTAARRDAIRKTTTNTTSARRKNLLLQIVESAGGISVLDVDFVAEYDKRMLDMTGIKQAADKKTLRRSFEDLHKEGKIKWTVRAIPNHTQRVSIRRDIYYLKSIDDDGADLHDFIEMLKLKEAQKKPSVIVHRPIEVVPRPEMDIIPTVAQRHANKSGIAPLKLTETELQQLRVRLSEKASKDDPSRDDAWYKGPQRLTSFKELVAARKAEREKRRLEVAETKAQEKKAVSSNVDNHKAIKKPKLRKILPKRVKTQIRNDELAEECSHIPPSPGPLPITASVSSSKPSSKIQRAKSSKKIKSKRADRLEEEENSHRPDDLVIETPSTRRRQRTYTDEEDDTLVRAANLSMLFFSKSDLQYKVEWPVVTAAMSGREEDALRRRYGNLRSRPRFKTIQNFILSPNFVLLYNEAVHKGAIAPVPKASAHQEGAIPFDIRPHIAFSRRFDPERRIASTDPLPQSIAEFRDRYNISIPSSVSESYWLDAYHLAGNSNIVQSSVLKRNAFVVKEAQKLENFNVQADHLLAAIKSLLMTPEDRYDAENGLSLLSKYGSPVEIEQMLKHMMACNLVVNIKGDSNRILPGRNYQLADKFFQRLKIGMPLHTMKSATAFDLLLKQAITAGKTVLYPQLANNGTAAATLELAVRGNIVIEQGHKKHWSSQGLMADYSIRSIESSALDFDLILTKSTEQWTNEPVTCLPEPPGIPCLWVDVHGSRMDVVYRKTIALIMNVIVKRGQVTFDELLRICSPVLTRHELEICLENLTRHAFVGFKEQMYSVAKHYYYATH